MTDASSPTEDTQAQATQPSKKSGLASVVADDFDVRPRKAHHEVATRSTRRLAPG